MTQIGDFRLATITALGMGITDGKILFCHGISELIRNRKIAAREYNYRIFYDCFNITFPVDCGKPDLNIPPMTINDSPRLKNRSCYTPDPFQLPFILPL